MTVSQDPNDDARPPLAVVGSQDSQEEAVFAAFDGAVIARFWEFVRPHKRLLWCAVIGVLLFTATQVVVPLLLRYTVDTAILKGEVALLHSIAIAFLVVVTANYVANICQELIVGKIAANLLFSLRRAMFAHLQHVSLSYMDRTEVGRLMSRLQGDVNSLQEFLETSIFAIGDFVLLLGIMGVLLWLDVQLGLLTLIVVPALLIVRIVWLPRARKVFLRARETSAIVNGALAENVHGIRAIQEMQREHVNYVLFGDKADENLRSHMRASLYSNIMVPIVDTLTGLAMAVIIIVGGSMVIDHELELGVVVAFLFYVQRFFDPIRSLTIQYSIMQRAMASGQRIFEVLDVPVTVKDRPGAQPLADHDGSIEFQDVTFGYVPDQPVIKNVSFRARAGETLALVGPTGSGKTSITALIHRFYDTWDGRILVGGQDVRDVTIDSLGVEIAMVLQEPYLFSGTIYDNIQYNSTDATREDIEAAAKAVGAHDFISALPNGYETELEQRGENLSLGQRQLLSFARALIRDAKILILDEATASVDSHTEKQIQDALAVLLSGRTAVVIAHRLATIRKADRILVLRDGEILEQGNHTSLLAANGLYADLHKLNYASFDDIG
ncbi:MAG: ABC transporter ATP-binding protein/permease [Gammaproteobacteria bacterium]|nr:ABC transporter ATP-binding protein/permease [Gammaproteobacteria bacterium]